MKKIIKLMAKSKPWFLFLSLVNLFLIVISGYFLITLNRLSGIENLIRLIVGIVVSLISMSLLLISVKRMIMSGKKKKKYIFKNIIFILFTSIYLALLFIISINVDKIMNKLGKVSSNELTYSSSLITLSNNSVNDIKDIGNEKLGILMDEASYEGYIIPHEVKNELKLKNEFTRYDNYVGMMQDLIEGKIKYVFVPTTYKTLFSSTPGLETIGDSTKDIYKKEKSVKQAIIKKANNSLTSPFTILLMGVDSEKDGIKGASFNGDSLILITFNPNTLSSTILSIPRDTYASITCFKEQRRNKITHAAWYGESCMINTISKLVDIKIDYYVKINFKGVVDLVNAVGGVTVDVPYNLCEQDSHRRWGANTVYIEKGLQNLNGEQALAFSRNRHSNPKMCSAKWTNYSSSDFVRAQNQQVVIRALMNKLKDVRSLDTFYEILNTISNNMETSLSTKEILSLYDVAKKAILNSAGTNMADVISMHKLYLDGYSQMIYDYSQNTNQGMKMLLYNYVPYTKSINAIHEAMEINLGLIQEKEIKSFEFSINNEYKEQVIGKGLGGGASYQLMDNLIGKTEEQARLYLLNHDIKFEILKVKAKNNSQKIGTVISQNIPAKTDLGYINKVTLEVVNESYKPAVTDCSLEENKGDKLCTIPTFKGETYTFVNNYFLKKYPKINTVYNYEDCADKTKDTCVVISQSPTSGSLYDYITDKEKEFKITFKDKVTIEKP